MKLNGLDNLIDSFVASTFKRQKIGVLAERVLDLIAPHEVASATGSDPCAGVNCGISWTVCSGSGCQGYGIELQLIRYCSNGICREDQVSYGICC